MRDLRIVVTGLIGQYPFGGMTWHYLQYLIGLAKLGCDVFYLEDTGQYPYDPERDRLTNDCSFNVDYLAAVFARHGLGDRWAYRFPWKDQWFGLPDQMREDVLRSADLLINVSGTLDRVDRYRCVNRLAYVDTDPVFTQLKLALGHSYLKKMVDLHDVHFSFGECLSHDIPSAGYDWLPTRQPIVLQEWEPAAARRDVFTTVMNWTSYKEVVYEGQSYGQKDVEFKKFIDLPARTDCPLELAISTGKTRRSPLELLAHKGWRVVAPRDVCGDADAYRKYIQSSKAEWSIAKNGYVRGKSGWFSERSACYLASGRPVITQETGFSQVISTGVGVVPFETMAEAIRGIDDVNAHYEQHSEAARSIAEQYFDSNQVLAQLVDRAMV